MNRRILSFLTIFLGATFSIFSQTAERNRGFYIEAGLGFGGVIYPDSVDGTLKLARDLGFDRTTISLGASVGWAVMQNLYVAGTITGFGDRFSKSDIFVQSNIYLYGLGVKYYPLSSRKHLQLGCDLGLGKIILVSNVQGGGTFGSEPGFAWRLSTAYDFDSTMTGLTALIGADCLMELVEGDLFTGWSIFMKVAFK